MYTDTLDTKVARAPRTIGNQLARFAVKLEFSVIRVALATGATRMTVYNWYKGGRVSKVYLDRVERLIDILQYAIKNGRSADDAWAQAVEIFDLDR